MTRSFLFLIAFYILCGTAAAAPKVVASIKPIHSLVASIMQGIGTPNLLIEGQTSPHTATLRPSQATALQNADIIFWVGPELETFLEKPLASLSSKGNANPLINLSDLHFPKHEEPKHEEPEHEKEHEESEHQEHDDHHHHHSRDPHIWLDPQNALVMAREIEAQLSRIDSANAPRYAANRKALVDRINTQQAKMAARLHSISNAKYITFHDAYSHFEHRFKLSGGHTATANPERQPSAARIKELRDLIKTKKIQCVFSEPQFNPKLVALLTEGTSAKSGELDPLGSSTAAGVNFYTTLMQHLATSFTDCLNSM